MDTLNTATLQTAEVPRKISDPTEGPDFVTALARGLTVIRAFGAERPQMTLADIAKRVSLPRATVRRSLITLEALGYVECDGRNFSLSPKVLALGNSYLTSSPFPRTIQPILERFAEKTGESCWAAILDDEDVLLVAGAERMAERDGTSIGIHLRRIVGHAQLAQHRQGLSGEGFVQLDDVHVADRVSRA